MPFRYTNKGWYWGSKGPFPTRAKAQQVAAAAYASGYKGEKEADNAIPINSTMNKLRYLK
jgi:hypothetical protein